MAHSYSSMDTYEGCPFKYKLKYVDRITQFNQTIATEFGTAVHDAEEQIAKYIMAGQPVDYKSIITEFIQTLDKIATKYPEEYLEKNKQNLSYFDKAAIYLNQTIYNLENLMKAHPTYKILGAEVKFNTVIADKYTFTGKIDRIIYDTATDTYILQDIKTWTEPLAEDKIPTPLQFVIYTCGMKELYNCTEDNIICQYSLPILNQTQNVATKGYVKRGIAKLIKIFNAIDNKEFKPNNKNALCAWCEYSITNKDAPEKLKYLCPYHCLWTNKNKIFDVANEWLGLENHEFVIKRYIEQLQAERGE